MTAEMQRDALELELDRLRHLLDTETRSRNERRAVIDELQGKCA